MIVRFHPRARQRVKVVTTWWKKNRLDAPTLFDDELADMIERLKDHPTRGVEYEVVDDMIFRRVLLRKSKQNVFYTFDERAGVIVIQSIWGAKRGRGPSLR